MKKCILTFLSILLLASVSPLRAANVGVPAECEDVMLQAFYWDSYNGDASTTKYGRTKWIDLLKDTAAITANFDLVWFPPSAGPTGNGVGYSAKQYSNQDSDWGSKNKLSQLIAALHRGNTKVLADVVLNHRGSGNSWCSFMTDNFGGSYGTWTLKSEHICKNDEVNSRSDAGSCKGAATGANDTGDNFDGARDLDHTSEFVQNWAKAYTQWLLGSMKYDGFRYDMTLGFHGQYLQLYNEAAQPYISVSELWHGIDRQKQHLRECDYNTMVFDFQAKYSLKGILTNQYGKLDKNQTFEGFRKHGLERYAVTFIDNHDTFDRGNQYGDNQFGNSNLSDATTKNRVLQANAYILSMPGIPCVFWPHWASYKEEINEMIALRKRAGIHSESVVTEELGGSYKYTATIQGHRGRVILRLGKNRSTEVPEGYELVIDGGNRGAYSLYYAEGLLGVDEVASKAAKGEKFLQDGKLYLRVREHVYDMLGNRIL